MPADIAVADVLARVAASRRYRAIDPALVARLAGEEIPKARNLADAEKRVKRRLHQIVGAFATQPDWERLLAELAAAQTASDAAFRAACRAAMATHASTRERLPILDRLYEEVFALTGAPASLLDIACGLNPLALPWMALPSGCRYMACDIDRGLVAFVDAFLAMTATPHSVDVCDIITAPRTEWTESDAAVDVALLLKALPSLEQQRAGVGRELLRAMPARTVVVSYPTRSLGGHGKGMAQTYRAQFAATVEGTGWEAAELEFPGELVFVVTKGQA